MCTAPASAGTFTIPSYVLLALPASNNAAFAFQPGDVAGPVFSTTFSASGLTVGIVQAFIDGLTFGGVILN